MTRDMQARCAAHGEAPAVKVCPRCGTFLCGECTHRAGPEELCGACLARLGRVPEASAQARACLYLGLAGLACGFLPGVAGLLLSYRELERIARRGAPSGGRALAHAGRMLGWLNTALLAVVAMVLLSRFLD